MRNNKKEEGEAKNRPRLCLVISCEDFSYLHKVLQPILFLRAVPLGNSRKDSGESARRVFSGGRRGPYRSKGCNKRGGHSWARMAPASRLRIQHRSLCAFLFGGALYD